MSPDNRRVNLQAEWEMSRRAQQAGRYLLAGGFHSQAVASFYYATFHAARALLLSADCEPATHTGVRSELHRLFVRPARLAPELARVLTSLQKEREDADYSPRVHFDESQARLADQDSALFCAAAETLLRSQGWLGAM